MAKSKEKINDFGQKIGGAKKDLWKERGLMFSDLAEFNTDELIKYMTKQNVWIKPDYQKLYDSGISRPLVYFYKCVYDAIPTTMYVPKDADVNVLKSEAKKYIDFINAIKEEVLSYKNIDDCSKFVNFIKNSFLEKNNYYYSIKDEWSGINIQKLYSVSKDFDRYTITTILNKINDKEFLYTEQEKINKAFKERFMFFETKDTTIKESSYKSEGVEYSFTSKSGLFTYISKNDVEKFKNSKTIVYDRAHGLMPFNDDIELVKSAIMIKFNAERTEINNKSSKKTNRKGKYKYDVLKNVERISKDNIYRPDNRNITGDDLLKDFNLYGGEFGNWENQDERQKNLNFAYDSFKDLAIALDLTDKEISFNGNLSVAFGARGSGSALAHYEPLRQVINLTKMKGAGSLAHEYGHFFDHIINKLSSESIVDTNFASENNKVISDKFPSLLELMSVMKFKVANDKEREEYKAREINKLKNVQVLKYFEKYKESGLYDDLSNLFNDIDNGLSSTEIKNSYENILKKYENLSKENSDNSEKSNAIYKSYLLLKRNERPFMYRINDYYNFIHKDLSNLTIDTNFYRGSKLMDGNYSKEGHGYWSDNKELFARAFACYIEDKLLEKGIRNTYLTGHASTITTFDINNNEFIPVYPDGEERKTINKAFDKYFDEVRTKIFNYNKINDKEIERFKKEVQKAINETKNFSIVKICDTPKILQEIGLQNKPILYSSSHLLNAIAPFDREKHHHGISINDIYNLPYYIKEPAIILKNYKDNTKPILVFDAVNSEKAPLFAVLNLNGKGYYEFKEIDSNFMLSVYGKDNFQDYLALAAKNNEILYYDKKRVQNLETFAKLSLLRCISNFEPNKIIQKISDIVNSDLFNEQKKIFVESLNFVDNLKKNDIDIIKTLIDDSNKIIINNTLGVYDLCKEIKVKNSNFDFKINTSNFYTSLTKDDKYKYIKTLLFISNYVYRKDSQATLPFDFHDIMSSFNTNFINEFSITEYDKLNEESKKEIEKSLKNSLNPEMDDKKYEEMRIINDLNNLSENYNPYDYYDNYDSKEEGFNEIYNDFYNDPVKLLNDFNNYNNDDSEIPKVLINDYKDVKKRLENYVKNYKVNRKEVKNMFKENFTNNEFLAAEVMVMEKLVPFIKNYNLYENFDLNKNLSDDDLFYSLYDYYKKDKDVFLGIIADLHNANALKDLNISERIGLNNLQKLFEDKIQESDLINTMKKIQKDLDEAINTKGTDLKYELGSISHKCYTSYCSVDSYDPKDYLYTTGKTDLTTLNGLADYFFNLHKIINKYIDEPDTNMSKLAEYINHSLIHNLENLNHINQNKVKEGKKSMENEKNYEPIRLVVPKSVMGKVMEVVNKKTIKGEEKDVHEHFRNIMIPAENEGEFYHFTLKSTKDFSPVKAYGLLSIPKYDEKGQKVELVKVNKNASDGSEKYQVLKTEQWSQDQIASLVKKKYNVLNGDELNYICFNKGQFFDKNKEGKTYVDKNGKEYYQIKLPSYLPEKYAGGILTRYDVYDHTTNDNLYVFKVKNDENLTIFKGEQGKEAETINITGKEFYEANKEAYTKYIQNIKTKAAENASKIEDAAGKEPDGKMTSKTELGNKYQNNAQNDQKQQNFTKNKTNDGR